MSATLPDDRYRIQNRNRIAVDFMPLGGTITSIWLPDRNGERVDVVPGFDTADVYQRDHRYFGALIGRFANRIARGRFSLDGHEYVLPTNDGPNHLHGGPNGFHVREWRVAPFQRERASGAVLCCKSAPADDGYPGTMIARVTYTLDDDDTLRVDYSAVSDAATIVSLTQHTYFNLRGHDRGDILDHELTINAAYFTPIDETSIPTGALRGVTGTPFDFTAARRIGEHIADDDEQLRLVGGYDHNFQLHRGAAGVPAFAARLRDPSSGRSVEIWTTEPGLQVYTGNVMDRGEPGKGGARYGKHAAIALETQHFPDSPNQPHFPSVVLRPGEELVSTTEYRFSTGSPS